ncbi:MAG: hypothetical protein BGO51_22990 [Rhodospirillales bacterium 69-11]|nr:MAG: hypothetical protein BGO51_22990 [Rhodospirillales bacterium 69-11]
MLVGGDAQAGEAGQPQQVESADLGSAQVRTIEFRAVELHVDGEQVRSLESCERQVAAQEADRLQVRERKAATGRGLAAVDEDAILERRFPQLRMREAAAQEAAPGKARARQPRVAEPNVGEPAVAERSILMGAILPIQVAEIGVFDRLAPGQALLQDCRVHVMPPQGSFTG